MLRKLLSLNNSPNIDNEKIDDIKLLQGAILSNLLSTNIESINDAEFSVFSQFGDDGLIQFLIKKIKDIPQTFIEFGVENYRESNTRFLLQNNNWSGLILDGSEAHIASIKQWQHFWKYDLSAIAAFITRENINELIQSHFNFSEIGLLHIDIDGMDYWVWDAIHLKPVIVIVEYNSIFGSKKAITVPYQSDFNRSQAHYSNLYAGASLGALCHLASKKGYSFLGCNSAGNNAYFIRNDKADGFTIKTAEEGYVKSKFRESRSSEGNLTFLRDHERIELIKGLPVFNVISNQIEIL